MNDQNFQQSKVLTQIFTVAAFVFTSLIASGQTTIAVAPNKMNVLYVGVDNPVSVAVSDNADDNVTISISGTEGTASKTAAGQYNVRVNTFTDNCTINVYVKGHLAGTSAFRVRSLPIPGATVGGFPSGSKLSGDVLKAQPGVIVYLKDVPFDLKYNVLGFTVKLVDDAKQVKEIYCEGAAFSPLARQYISDYVKSGDLVSIQNIRVRGEDGKELKLPGLIYAIN